MLYRSTGGSFNRQLARSLVTRSLGRSKGILVAHAPGRSIAQTLGYLIARLPARSFALQFFRRCTSP